MDGFSSADQVLVIGATNLSKVLDPAIMRPGRFDRKFMIPLPDKSQREKLVIHHFKLARPNSKIYFDKKKIALQTVGFSPADLANLVNTALLEAFKNQNNYVDNKDFQNAFEKLVTGVKRKTYADSDTEKLIVALRLASMAGIAFTNKKLVDYSYISLLPRDEIDGQIRTACLNERVFENENQLLAALDLSLASREAEIFFYGNEHASIASMKYLKQAGELARLHARLYGNNNLFRQGNPTHSSEHLRQQMDHKVNLLITQRKLIVQDHIKKMEDKITKLASKLIVKEAMPKEEAEKIFDGWSLL